MTTQSEGLNRWRSLSKLNWTLIILAIVAIVAVVGWLRPVQVVVDKVAEPVAQQVGIASRTCPSGWSNTSARDEHLQVLSCQKAGWLVVLDAEGKFQYGVQLDTQGAEFQYNPSNVPGWASQ